MLSIHKTRQHTPHPLYQEMFRRAYVFKQLMSTWIFLIYILTPIQGIKTIQDLISQGSISLAHNSCLTETGKSLHSVNKVFSIPNNIIDIVPGYTYWINDFMAVGYILHFLTV
jgi:hypothetical protein